MPSIECPRFATIQQNTQNNSFIHCTLCLYAQPPFTPNSLLQPTIGGICLCNKGWYFLVKGVGGRQAASKVCEGINTIQDLAVNLDLRCSSCGSLARWNNTSVFLILIVSRKLCYNWLSAQSYVGLYSRHNLKKYTTLCWLTIGGLGSLAFSSSLILWLVKTGCTSVFIFRLRSLSCSRSLGCWGSARTSLIAWFLKCFFFATLSQN